MLLMAWYFRALSLSIPICLNIVTEKYWMALTPVIWMEAWRAQAMNRRRKEDLESL
jgi:hypothetical protein